MSSIYDRLTTLGMPARVRILRLLELEELQVGEIAAVVQMPQSTVSRHLKTLHDDGWVVRRREGTATWFALSDQLAPEARALWELVSGATDGEHPDDGLRLAAVLAARQVDSRTFLGRLAGNWSEVRRELYGDAFLLHALAALLPADWTVADLGCGPGDLLAALAPGVRRAVGIDREPAMLEAAAARLAGRTNVELRAGVLEDPPLACEELDAALLVLVLHFVPAPEAVLRAVAPALKRGGRVVIVDLVAHDRDEYRRTMGHQHLGFDRDDVARMAAAGGLCVERHEVLPPSPEATGPALFLAVLSRPR